MIASNFVARQGGGAVHTTKGEFMRTVAVVLFLAAAQMASAGVIYDFFGSRNGSTFAATLTLPDYLPLEVNVTREFTPGVDDLVCNGCTYIWMINYYGTSWSNDEVWWGWAGGQLIFRFASGAFSVDGVHPAEFDDATLTVSQREGQSGVPEPGSMALVLTGGAAAFLWSRRRRTP
jgi:hypothetical protein